MPPKDRCPLLGRKLGTPVISGDIPDFCWERCGAEWDLAVNANRVAEDYDVYPAADNSECRHTSIEFSHDALVAVNKVFREYVVVDQCADCNTEIGEQAYKFECRPKAQEELPPNRYR